MFYTSKEWRRIRNIVIARDYGCDLAIPELEIIGEKILIHHINPLTKDDIINKTDFLLNPEFLVCCTDRTHKFIHFGNRELITPQDFVERTPFDTSPWRK